MEKSLQFTDLTAELDKKWAETVGRECARVKDEVTSKLQADFQTTRSNLEDYHTTRVAEIQNDFKQQLQLLKSTNSNLNDKISELVIELKDVKKWCAKKNYSDECFTSNDQSLFQMDQTTKVFAGETLLKSHTGHSVNHTVSVQTDSQFWLGANQPKKLNLEFHTKMTSAGKRVSKPYLTVFTFAIHN
ncbi:hypothetical protein AHF37_12511 [Paragonimus kellicotti]|nr:hypothetical protein AHF37_12511 [Paragonimus kellicotti]